MTCPLCGSENIYIVLETGEVDCEDCEYHYPTQEMFDSMGGVITVPLDKRPNNS